MKNHVLRPLFVVIGIVVLILLARMCTGPEGFRRAVSADTCTAGTGGATKKTGRRFKVKYQGKEYCKDCHTDKYDSINKTPHRIIQCENCHGPGDRASVGPAQARDRQEQGALPAVPFPAALSHKRTVEDQGHRSGQA